MPKRFDLIVFDWDGTLADSTQMIVDCLQAASKDAGLPVPERSAAGHIIGLGLDEAIEALFGELTETQFQQLVTSYRYHYYARDEETSLFTGVAAAIVDLKQRGFMLAVATGKGRRGLNKSLEHSGLAQYFDATRCVDECRSKPDPQMLLELMQELKIGPERTLLVGDTSYDLQMAQNASVACLAVTYGAHAMDHLLLHAPLAYFDDFAALNQWLLVHG